MTGFVYSDIYLQHNTGKGHPETSRRLEVIMQHLKETGLLEKAVLLEPLKASEEDVQLVHSTKYIEIVRDSCAKGRFMLPTGDTLICPESYEVALYAVGGVLKGIDEIFQERVKNVFVLCRPPGHHAEPDAGMGFCVFNNAAVAARYAQKKYSIKNVLIIDWDYHHGNGTQNAFYFDPSVYYFSSHRFPAYPGTGLSFEEGISKGSGYNKNIPLGSGITDEEIYSLYLRELPPIFATFKPELVVISAGFDIGERDPIGDMSVTAGGFGKLTSLILELACQSRVLAVLEGGYSLELLPFQVEAVLKEMIASGGKEKT